MSVLETVWCSKASVRQRGGRAARVMPGTAVRLIPRSAFGNLADHDPPEVLNAPLAKVGAA